MKPRNCGQNQECVQGRKRKMGKGKAVSSALLKLMSATFFSA
jgi:hypothetical protein